MTEFHPFSCPVTEILGGHRTQPRPQENELAPKPVPVVLPVGRSFLRVLRDVLDVVGEHGEIVALAAKRDMGPTTFRGQEEPPLVDQQDVWRKTNRIVVVNPSVADSLRRRLEENETILSGLGLELQRAIVIANGGISAHGAALSAVFDALTDGLLIDVQEGGRVTVLRAKGAFLGQIEMVEKMLVHDVSAHDDAGTFVQAHRDEPAVRLYGIDLKELYEAHHPSYI